MDLDSCSICSTPYVVFRDYDGARWRYLCRCEAAQRCSKGKHPATHAKLVPSGDVERYACDEHGLPTDERPAAPALPARSADPEAATSSKANAPERPRRKPPTPPPPRVQHDILTLAGFKAAIEEDKLQGRCRKCRRERMLIDSDFRPMEGTPLYDLICPHCGHNQHDFL